MMTNQYTAPDIASLVRTGVEPVVGYRPGASPLSDQPSARLDWNESPFGLSPKAQDALTTYRSGNRYPDYMQTPLREALATYVGTDVDRIIPGAGLDDVFNTLAMLLLEPGDEVIICEPTFGVYRSLFSMHGARIVNVPLSPAPDFSLNVDGILAAVTNRTKLVMLCQPNNPTGNLMPREDIERIVSSVPAIVGIDEAYAEFSGANHLDLADRFENVVLFRTLSKFAGLAGFRVGYGIFPPSTLPYLARVAPPFYDVSAISSAVAVASLADLSILNANLRIAGRTRAACRQSQRDPGSGRLPVRDELHLGASPGRGQRTAAEGSCRTPRLRAPLRQSGPPSRQLPADLNWIARGQSHVPQCPHRTAGASSKRSLRGYRDPLPAWLFPGSTAF